jgi:hypothetical protein
MYGDYTGSFSLNGIVGRVNASTAIEEDSGVYQQQPRRIEGEVE